MCPVMLLPGVSLVHILQENSTLYK